jgi:hypothetical protein
MTEESQSGYINPQFFSSEKDQNFKNLYLNTQESDYETIRITQQASGQKSTLPLMNNLSEIMSTQYFRNLNSNV